MSEQLMVRTQVYLTAEQERGLKRLAASTGRKQSELIREAIQGYLAERKPKDRTQALEACFGMWADHGEIDDLMTDMRREAEERLDRVWQRRS